VKFELLLQRIGFMKFCSKCSASYTDDVKFCPRDGEPLVQDSLQLAGRILDDQYEIEAFIARGGMGTIYRARHTLLGDRVAIKVLRPEMRDNEEWLQRFLREGQVARRFRHPNAVTVYDLRVTDDRLVYMVMEYVEGRTLDAELKRRGRFTPEEAFRVLEPVADVLDAAHKRGIVHRDLKPENVMLGGAATESETAGASLDDQNIKLLDLGIAKMVETAAAAKPAASLTLIGQLLGTPYYMSPEQWGELPRDGNAEVDNRTDIYSFGVMLYELVSGVRPFGGKSVADLRRAHVEVAPRLLHEVAPGVGVAFSRAVSRALAKDRADRPVTAGALAEELRLAFKENPSARGLSANIAAPTLSKDSGDQNLTSLQSNEDYRARGEARTTHPQPPAANNGAFRHLGANVHAPTSMHAPVPPYTAGSAGAMSAASSNRSLVLTLLAATLGLFLLFCVAAAGWFAWLQTRKGAEANGGQPEVRSNSLGNGSANAGSVQALRYWLDIYPPLVFVGEHERIAGSSLRLPGGRQAKFYVASPADGYLYIIAPNEEEQLTAYLTAVTVPELELSSNAVRANTNFAFPGGNASITIATKPSTGTMTLIFSPTPLTSPTFLNRRAMRVLSPGELAELEAFRRANAGSAPQITVGHEDGDESKPFAAVNVPKTTIQAGKPVIVQIALQNTGS